MLGTGWARGVVTMGSGAMGDRSGGSGEGVEHTRR